MKPNNFLMTHLLLAAVSSLASGFPMLFAQPPAWQPAAGRITMNLWPHGAPGTNKTGGTPHLGPEVDTTKATDGKIAGRPITRLTNVSTPTLTLYEPTGKNPGAAVVVFPGGGYSILAIDHEGTEVCEWLNSVHVNCVLVKYRVPDSGPYPKFPAALEDAQRALSLVRAHAAEWHIDPGKIGVLGFSAGGHLAAAASTHFNGRVYAPVDAADKQSCRPDFTVLVYPAYLVAPARSDASAKPGAHSNVRTSPLLSRDIEVSPETPPAFLVQAEDDSAAPVENSIVYFLALKKAGIQAEMHVYAQGGHGFGLRRAELPVTGWPQLAENWLRTIKVLPPPVLPEP